jgi:hypothetical protein
MGGIYLYKYNRENLIELKRTVVSDTLSYSGISFNPVLKDMAISNIILKNFCLFIRVNYIDYTTEIY